MLLLIIMVLVLILNIFVFAPFIFIGLSHLFSDELFSYKKSFLLCLQILLVSLLLQVIQFAFSSYLPALSVLSGTLLTLATIIIVVYIIKLKFDTSILKAILIWVISIISGAILGVIIAVPTRNFICQAYKIPAGSNIPTLLIGDQILANKFIYRFSSPERNDLVVFKFPQNEKLDYIKRIIALPNEEVKIVNKKLFINGKPVVENFAMYKDDTILTGKGSVRDNFGPFIVPEDSYFVLGDNRDNSFDSRFWGVVKKDKIKGKAEVVYYSYDKDSQTIRTDRIGKEIK